MVYNYHLMSTTLYWDSIRSVWVYIFIIVHFSHCNTTISFWVFFSIFLNYTMKAFFFIQKIQKRLKWRCMNELQRWKVMLLITDYRTEDVLSPKLILHHDGSEYSEKIIIENLFNDMNKECVIGCYGPHRAEGTETQRQQMQSYSEKTLWQFAWSYPMCILENYGPF